MPTGTFQYQDEAERLSIETAIAFVAEMRQLALTAPNSQVISLCEGRALDKGRALLRSTLEEAVQARIDSAEQKGGSPATAPARARAGSTTSGATVLGICRAPWLSSTSAALTAIERRFPRRRMT